MNVIAEYQKKLEHALKAGNATEHTHRPALKALIESLRTGITATNEPQRIECGSPDFIVTRKNIPLGYIEAKDVGVDLDRAEDTEQLKRYRSSLRNLILTDYLEFRLFRNGDSVQSVCLGKLQKNGVLRRNAEAPAQLENFLHAFLDAEVPTITSPRGLAERMARLARLVHDLIRETFAHEGKKGDLHGQYEAFQRVLIADLSVDQFADMYAQTIAYGLFAARCNHTGPGFTREHAGRELPKTNPFLRKLFNTIAGADLDDRISWAVDDLAELLARADTEAILEDFGKATRQQDPVVHFYETFLAAYDPKLRETRGVYYTPEPVVSYIVRSIDAILKREFGLKTGLADRSTTKIQIPTPYSKKKTKEFVSHRVQILDPACGTGTFLHAVIAQVREGFSGAKGLWPSYVAEHLLPRLYGFELLMAPYAVAHMKLGLQLQETGYDFAAAERLRVFLTNSLEEGHEFAGLPLFAQWLADEAAAASEVKREAPIMIVLGNPPYANYGMMNKGTWILDLIQDYKRDLGEKKLNLDDDFIKFIRFGQWRIQQTGYGVLGYITNHTYLDGLTHRRMRESLMETFNEIYVLNLHGNSNKKEQSPTGERDDNVFDIQQGVAIGIFVKRTQKAEKSKVFHADLWGLRTTKYETLNIDNVITTKWQELKPHQPYFFFVPKSFDAMEEYEKGWSLENIFPVNQNGIKTDRDTLFVDFDRKTLEQRMSTFYSSEGLQPDFRELYNVQNSSSYDLLERRERTSFDAGAIHPFLYRPFDSRWLYYQPGLTSRPALEVMQHMLSLDNIAMITTRQTAETWSVLVTNHICGHKSCAAYDINTVFPLYLRADSRSLLGDNNNANLDPRFIAEFSKCIGLAFTPDGRGDGKSTFGPPDVFAYIYAVLHSPGYRTRYAELLKIAFPRIPLISDREVFSHLLHLGQRLIELHLLKSTGANQPGFPIAGSNRVDAIKRQLERVYINKEQYFEGVPDEVWNFYVGGYQVADKWLKDRKGRLMTFNELDQYRQIVAALNETIRIQVDIDEAIPGWPLR